jgi:DsbC/DsbD-like thiol-disulfide interchange protein
MRRARRRLFLRLSGIVAVLALGCARSAPGPGGNPSALPVPSAASRPEEPPDDLPLEEPTPAQPVVVGAALRPAKVPAGGTLTLYVQARIAPTWHIYGANVTPSGNAPTTLTLQLPRGIEPAGPWVYPEGTTPANGAGVQYGGRVTFRRHLRVADDARPGPVEVRCEFGYQACDPFSCQPPATRVVTAAAEVVAKD